MAVNEHTRNPAIVPESLQKSLESAILPGQAGGNAEKSTICPAKTAGQQRSSIFPAEIGAKMPEIQAQWKMVLAAVLSCALTVSAVFGTAASGSGTISAGTGNLLDIPITLPLGASVLHHRLQDTKWSYFARMSDGDSQLVYIEFDDERFDYSMNSYLGELTIVDGDYETRNANTVILDVLGEDVAFHVSVDPDGEGLELSPGLTGASSEHWMRVD